MGGTNLRAKVAVLGDSTVGKTAIVQMLKSDGSYYPKNYVTTIGAELSTKVVQLPDTDVNMEFYLFDISGKSFYEKFLTHYLQGTGMFVLVYDVTNLDSFNNCAKWLEILRAAYPNQWIPGVLIANKVDLEERAVVPQKKGVEFASVNKLAFFESSALRGTNITEPFVHLGKLYLKYFEEKIQEVAVQSLD